MQGEKGEPGAILTGDIPLERLQGKKVIVSPDPEGNHLCQHPRFVPAMDCGPLNDKFMSSCFRVNLESTEPRDQW